jgi:hypothetical protein
VKLNTLHDSEFSTAICEYSGILGHDVVPVGSKIQVHLQIQHVLTGRHDPSDNIFDIGIVLAK